MSLDHHLGVTVGVGNKRYVGRAILIILVGALAGCATPRQPYNRAAHQDIKVACLLQPGAGSDYEVVNLGHPGGMFGLIGGLIAAADAYSKTTEFTNAAKKLGLDVPEAFKQALVAAIESRGYRVKVLDVKRPRPGLLEKYDALDAECDAYVDTVIRAAYLSASATADYFPSVVASVRVVKRRTLEIVYGESIAYGFQYSGGTPVQITADPKYRFKDFPALMANVPLATAGLQRGVPDVVTQIGRDLHQ